MTPQLDRIIAVRLVTRDPARLTRFYAEALGAEIGEPAPIPATEAALVGAGERRALRLGAQRVELDAFAEPGAPYPTDIAADDRRFQHIAVVTVDIAAAFARTIRCGARPISLGGPVTLPAASGGVTAVKLRDPEGHPFELLALPDGRWDGVAANACAVQGIDHSAIVVRDLSASRSFYARLGLVERGATLNRGAAQAALDGLDAPVVDVAPFYPPHPTPHLELLHYRGPERSSVSLADRDVAATCVVWSAPGASSLSLLRDPDGHRHLLQPSTGALPAIA